MFGKGQDRSKQKQNSAPSPFLLPWASGDPRAWSQSPGQLPLRGPTRLAAEVPHHPGAEDAMKHGQGTEEQARGRGQLL